MGWPGRILPNQARYQLRYARLFSYFIRLAVFSQREGRKPPRRRFPSPPLPQVCRAISSSRRGPLTYRVPKASPYTGKEWLSRSTFFPVKAMVARPFFPLALTRLYWRLACAAGCPANACPAPQTRCPARWRQIPPSCLHDSAGKADFAPVSEVIGAQLVQPLPIALPAGWQSSRRPLIASLWLTPQPVRDSVKARSSAGVPPNLFFALPLLPNG